MKLTKAQRELLHQWHRLDQAAGCRQWHTPNKRQRAGCSKMWDYGLVEWHCSYTVFCRLTDEAANLIEKGGES